MNLDNIDMECRELVKAMNQFPGIQTVESCCGHGERPFHIWFFADNLESLPPLLYWTDICHTGQPGWRVVVDTDCSMNPAVFMLEGPNGDFEAANIIAELMNEYNEET